MTIQSLAILFLALRLVSLVFVSLVLYRQIRLFRLRIDTELVRFRLVMFLLGLVLFVGSLYPIYFDLVYALNLPVENDTLLVSRYALSNVLSFLAGSIVLWNIYRIAGADLDEQQDKEDSHGTSSR